MPSGRGRAWCLTCRTCCLCVILSGCFQPCAVIFLASSSSSFTSWGKRCRFPLDAPCLSTNCRQPLLSNVLETLSMSHTQHFCESTVWMFYWGNCLFLNDYEVVIFRPFFLGVRLVFNINVITLIWGVGPRWNTAGEQRRGENQHDYKWQQKAVKTLILSWMMHRNWGSSMFGMDPQTGFYQKIDHYRAQGTWI